jgi:hypothetical protein
MRLNLATLLAFTLLISHVAMAQEAEESETGVEEFEPAVSSAELAEMDSTDPDEAEPAVPSAVLAQDVRRTASASGVMDEIDLAASEITGNQELPKVLYIVPWQKSEAGELVGKPVNTLLDEVLAPIDRSEFLRQVDYYGDLYREEEE